MLRTFTTVGIAQFACFCVCPQTLLAQETFAQEPAAAAIRPAQSVRLRVAWGGGQSPRPWRGRITLSEGMFSEMQLLGMEADAAGSIWHDQNTIYVDAIRPHRFDGFDITVTGGERASLAVELLTDGVERPAAVNVPIADATSGAVRQELDDKKNVLLVHRAPGDTLRIETGRDSLIFAPGEEFEFTLRPAPGQLTPGKTVDLAVTLAPARGGVSLWNVQHQRQPVPINDDFEAKINVPLPREEGVYTVHVTLADPPGFAGLRMPGGRNKPIVERSFQVVVLHLSTDQGATEPTWQTVWEFDPSNRRLLRMPTWAQKLPGIPQGTLGSIEAASVEHTLGRFIELPPTPAGGEPHWQAYPLPIQMFGIPHIVEVEYPADKEQHLGLSVIEPNSAGRAVPIGRDSGVYVEGLGAADQTQRHRHRYVFWPRTNSPLLLVSNLHTSAAATYGRIRVERASGSLAGGAGKAPWQSAQRLVTAYIARPLAPETFGASEHAVDVASGQSVDDSQTFFESARRLSEYLPFAGYNGAVVSVFADGSAIYPSRQLLSTPLYDTGRTVAGARGVPAADPLELMLRVFDRESLAFIPAIQLATPLPAIEALRRNSDPKVSGLEWVGPDGQTWLQSQRPGRGLAPYYNLLDDRVQQAIFDVVDELLVRYGHHPALAGLAVQLSSDGYGQLPSLNWGMDDSTVAQFERDTRIRLTKVDGPGRFAARQAELTGDGKYSDVWRSWRAARVTKFYARLAGMVQSAGGDRRLILTTEEMFSTPRLKNQLRPNVLANSPIERLMLDVGIDRKKLEQTPGLVFCGTKFIEPMSPLVDRAVDLEINESNLAAGELAEKRGPTGTVFYHRPLRTRLETFDAKSPWQSSTWMVSQSAADATAARKRFVTALEASDPAVIIDGGELLPMGQEPATRSLLRIMQQIPIGGDFGVLRQQPVTLRTYPSTDGITLVAINSCPWPAQADVSLDLMREAALQRLTEPSAGSLPDVLPQSLAAGAQTLPLRLEPYDLQVVRVTSGGVRVAGMKATISDAAKAELEALLATLSRRDLIRRSPYEKLSNPDFEASGGAGPVPGWRLIGEGANATAELDATKPHGGTTSLYLSSRGPMAAVESEIIPTPLTGQLFLTVWLRGENLTAKSAMRIVFETEGQGASYRNFSNTQLTHPLPPEWQPYCFYVSDLPLESTGRMRVKFELDGVGEVWVDEVRLYDLLFPEKSYQYSVQERQELVILLHAAQKAHLEGRISDCVRALEGYWPRFLLAYTSPIEPAPAVALQTAPVPAEPAATLETPSTAPAESTPLLKRIWPPNWF